MAGDFGIIAIDILLFFQILTLCSCADNTQRFYRISEIEGKSCPSEDIVNSWTTPTKISCTDACSKDPDCKSVFYSPDDLMCTASTRHNYVSGDLEDKPGNTFYTSVSPDVAYLPIDCGSPSAANSHVVLGLFDGNSTYGASVDYTCTPCTYLPLPAKAAITCQADGTWSAAVCVFGRDVGYLPNGIEIPEGAPGCGSVHNVTCTYMSVTNGFTLYGGYGRCECDDICCNYGDCCYDANCN